MNNPKNSEKSANGHGYIHLHTPFPDKPKFDPKKKRSRLTASVFFTQNRHHCFQGAHDILAAQVEEI
jgi:hypothetical protein